MREAYAEYVDKAADKPAAEWFAGYAALVVGDQETRDKRRPKAIAAYGEAVERLQRSVGITDRSRLTERTPTAALTFATTTPEAVATELGERGIATWWGDFYATGLIERLGLAPDGVLRIGLTHYNTAGEVDRLLDELRDILG